MDKLREAATAALAQLEINRTNFRKGPSKSICKMLSGGNDEIITALRAALAEQPAEQRSDSEQQEPVLRYDVLHEYATQHRLDYNNFCRVVRTALAEQPAEQEPVAWAMRRPDGLILDVICPDEHEAYEGQYTVPLYAAPQPCREVELTDEEIACALDAANVPELPDGYESVELEIARAVIEAYEEKNT